MKKILEKVYNIQFGEDVCIMLNSLTQMQEHSMNQFPTQIPKKGRKSRLDRCLLNTNVDLYSEAVLHDYLVTDYLKDMTYLILILFIIQQLKTVTWNYFCRKLLKTNCVYKTYIYIYIIIFQSGSEINHSAVLWGY